MIACRICNKEIKAGTDITSYLGKPAHPDCAIQHHNDIQAKIPQLPVTILHPIPQPDNCFYHHSLRHCPFCGSPAKLSMIAKEDEDVFYVKCTYNQHVEPSENENQFACHIVPSTPLFDSIIEAINAWNGRVNNPNATSTLKLQIHKHFLLDSDRQK